MSKFRREGRYFVLKWRDINDAKLPEDLMQALEDISNATLVERIARGKWEPLECVVIESDWDVYETAWKLVELEHERNQLAERNAELVAINEALEKQLGTATPSGERSTPVLSSKRSIDPEEARHPC